MEAWLHAVIQAAGLVIVVVHWVWVGQVAGLVIVAVHLAVLVILLW